MASLARLFLWKPSCHGNAACLVELGMSSLPYLWVSPSLQPLRPPPSDLQPAAGDAAVLPGPQGMMGRRLSGVGELFRIKNRENTAGLEGMREEGWGVKKGDKREQERRLIFAV